jgi:ribose 5-phosphate isomerase A
MNPDPHALQAIATRALELVADNSVLGLGTGHAAAAFLHALGERVRQGLRVRGVPTSRASADLARQLGIPLTNFDEVETLDVAIDGADEVDPQLNLIKGLGGALVREKIVAAAARRFVILVGDEKLVPTLGAHGTLPVEVVPFALGTCRRRLAELAGEPCLRLEGGKPYVSDNGNHILDCRVGPLPSPRELELQLRAVPGVVGTGLFLGMAHMVLIGKGDTVEVRERHE